MLHNFIYFIFYKINGIAMNQSIWKIITILSSLATMVMFAETMLVPAIPDIIQEFRLTYNISSWILTIYLTVGAVMAPIIGRIADIYGKKRMLIIIMCIYFIGLVIGSVSSSIYMLLMARGIQGLGIAMFPLAFSIVREMLPSNKISIGQGFISSMFAIGSILGLLIGASIVHYYGWRSTFLSIMPIAVALIFLISRFITKEPKGIIDKGIEKTIDVKSSILLALTIVTFLIAVTYLAEYSYQITYITSFILSSLFFALFIIREKNSKKPLIDSRIFLNRILLPANIMIMIVGLSMFMVFQTIPILIKSPAPYGLNGNEFDFINIQLPFSLTLLIVGPATGFIISRFGSIKPLVLGSIITAVSFILLFQYHESTVALASILALTAAGLSLMNVGGMNIIITSAPREYLAATQGITQMLRIVGSAIGPAIAGVIMHIYSIHDPMSGNIYPLNYAYNTIFLIAVMVGFVSFALALVIKHNRSSINDKYA
jgi:MFS family permease